MMSRDVANFEAVLVQKRESPNTGLCKFYCNMDTARAKADDANGTIGKQIGLNKSDSSRIETPKQMG